MLRMLCRLQRLGGHGEELLYIPHAAHELLSDHGTFVGVDRTAPAEETMQSHGRKDAANGRSCLPSLKAPSTLLLASFHPCSCVPADQRRVAALTTLLSCRLSTNRLEYESQTHPEVNRRAAKHWDGDVLVNLAITKELI